MNIDSIIMMFTLNYDKFQNNLNSIYLIAIFGIIKYFVDNVYYIRNLFTKLYNKVLYKTSVEMSIRIEYISKYSEYTTKCSDNAEAMLWEYLSNKNIADKKSNLKEFAINMDIKKKVENKNDYHDNYLLAINDKPLEIVKDIYIYFQVKKDKVDHVKTKGRHNEDEQSLRSADESTVITMFLVSKYHNSLYIENYMETIYKKYYKWQVDVNHSIKRIYFTSDKRLNSYDFNSTKSFKNLFFAEKDKIIDRLDFYKNSVEEYKRLGIPHTLGLMFYGEPGCGKTSCIKAIANYLDRHIVSINLAHINNIRELRNMFLNEEYLYADSEMNSSYRVLSSKRIYVFEEIDCNSKQNVLLDRNLAEKISQEPEEQSNAEMLASVLTDTFKKDSDKKTNASKTKPTLTLGEILELLDGISESSDRICIFTTNYPDKLDKALLRPGRVDLLVEFKKLRAVDINNLYKLWFNIDIPNNILKRIPDYTISQAEFGKLCFQYKHSGKPRELLDHIIKEYSLKI